MLVHHSAISIDSLSIFCSLLIIGTLLYFPKLRRRRVWVMIVGISVGDIIFSFHHGLDHVLSATNIYHWPVNGPLCTWLGIGTTAGFFYQSGWILCMSISLLYEFHQDMLVKPKVIPMKYFFVFTTVIGILPWLIGLSGGWMGRASEDHPTWCHFYFGYPLAGLLLFDMWMIIFNVLLIIFYILLGYRLHQMGKNRINTQAKKAAIKALRRIILFPLVYSFQWMTYCAFLFCEFAGTSPGGLVEAVVLTANGGGIWNGIIYYGMIIIVSRYNTMKATNPSLKTKTLGTSKQQSTNTDSHEMPAMVKDRESTISQL